MLVISFIMLVFFLSTVMGWFCKTSSTSCAGNLTRRFDLRTCFLFYGVVNSCYCRDLRLAVLCLCKHSQVGHGGAEV
jgi:hypothetical protein